MNGQNRDFSECRCRRVQYAHGCHQVQVSETDGEMEKLSIVYVANLPRSVVERARKVGLGGEVLLESIREHLNNNWLELDGEVKREIDRILAGWRR